MLNWSISWCMTLGTAVGGSQIVRTANIAETLGRALGASQTVSTAIIAETLGAALGAA